MKLTSRDIELAVVNYLNPRMNAIVPNVWWGLDLHYEADLVVLRPSGYAIEVEIKTSAADIVADTKKGGFAHESKLFRQLWFAVPVGLAQHPQIPVKAGIFAICNSPNLYPDSVPTLYLKVIRAAKLNRAAIQWDDQRRKKLYELGLMRIWTLKKKLQEYKCGGHIRTTCE